MTEEATSQPITPLPPLGEETDLRDYLGNLGYKDLTDIRVIESLLEEKRINLSTLPSVITRAKEKGQNLAQTLVDMNLVNSTQILDLQAKLYDMKAIELRNADVQEGLAHMISAEEALDWHVLPFSRTDFGELLVAISEPGNVLGREKIQKKLTKERVVFCLAAPGELASYIEQTYNVGVEKLSEELESGTGEAEENIIVRDVAVEAPVIRLVDNIIKQARDQRASDIHIEPHMQDTLIRFRIDGSLRDHTTVNRRVTPQIVARIKTLANMRTDERRVPQDGRVTLDIDGSQLDLRVVTSPTIYGEQVTMRLLDPSQAMLTLEELGMSENNLQRYLGSIEKAHGVALITGPTGSGKSTTLYSSLRRIVTSEKKLISIEDPVEYRLKGITQIDVSSGGLVTAENEGKRLTFANALRSILRSDPDIVMVGEIRDHETAQIAIDASLTGHFLYSTLHTNDALSAITRLNQLGISPFLVAEAVEVIVSQRLTRCLCTSCKQPYQANMDTLRNARAPEQALRWAEKNGGKELYRANPEGCKDCLGIGYKGRVGVHEVINITSELREAIVEDAKHHQLEKIARQQEMPSLYEDAFIKAWQGKTSLEEINRVVV